MSEHAHIQERTVAVGPFVDRDSSGRVFNPMPVVTPTMASEPPISGKDQALSRLSLELSDTNCALLAARRDLRNAHREIDRLQKELIAIESQANSALAIAETADRRREKAEELAAQARDRADVVAGELEQARVQLKAQGIRLTNAIEVRACLEGLIRDAMDGRMPVSLRGSINSSGVEL